MNNGGDPGRAGKSGEVSNLRFGSDQRPFPYDGDSPETWPSTPDSTKTSVRWMEE